MPAIDIEACTANAVHPAPPPFTPRDFRDAMGQFATGVVVISTEHDGQAHAMTANAFMSGSLAPPLVLVSVAHSARMHARIPEAGAFGISILAQSQQPCSNHFAGKPSPIYTPRFDRVGGMPVVAGAAVQLAATLRHSYACGDHTLFVGEVQALVMPAERGAPLMFHGGRYSTLAGPAWTAPAFPDGFWADHEISW
jgi:flavin reductase (DIM6/NTAB) family NADH-FMN oxidoreductase RutF